jgi:hypothetical protein
MSQKDVESKLNKLSASTTDYLPVETTGKNVCSLFIEALFIGATVLVILYEFDIGDQALGYFI